MRDGIDVIREPTEAPDLIAEEAAGLVIPTGDAIVESFEIGGQCGDGSAQLASEIRAVVVGSFRSATVVPPWS